MIGSTGAPLVIDLALQGGPVYCGRAVGEALRALMLLDEADERGQPVVLHVPANTYTVSSGFFLGLFGPSIRKAGSAQAFRQRVSIEAPEFLQGCFKTWIQVALMPRL